MFIECLGRSDEPPTHGFLPVVIKDRRERALSGMTEVDRIENRVSPGWLPITLNSKLFRIRWIKTGTGPLNEPLFRETVRKLQAGKPGASECETELFLLQESFPRPSWVPPAGIIFHMTRCGSTLVANALRMAERSVVVSESNAMAQMMEWVGSVSRYWSHLGAEYIGALATAFAYYRGGDPGQVVIKCTTSGTWSLAAVRALWPSIPCLILIRNPLEVLVSNSLKPPVWYVQWYNSRQVPWLGIPPTEVMAGNIVDYCAWVIGRSCSEALGAIGEGCQILDYSEITPHVIKRVGEHFNLRFSVEGERAIADVLQRDAKNPNRTFAGDSAAKRQLATDHMRASAAKWIEKPYEQLRNLSATWNCSSEKSIC